jgi:hypothetical protein
VMVLVKRKMEMRSEMRSDLIDDRSEVIAWIFVLPAFSNFEKAGNTIPLVKLWYFWNNSNW